MSIDVERMTAAEFLALPPDDVRSELIHGEVVVMSPSPNFDHGYAVTKLSRRLDEHVERHHLGQVYSDLDCYFSSDDVRRPDIFFFATARLHLIAGAGKPHASPDLCIEVLSPCNAGYDRIEKFDVYQAAGVPFYWIVDPMEQTLEAYKLVNGIYVRSGHGSGNAVLKLPPFDDLEIPLATLWRPTIATQP